MPRNKPASPLLLASTPLRATHCSRASTRTSEHLAHVPCTRVTRILHASCPRWGTIVDRQRAALFHRFAAENRAPFLVNGYQIRIVQPVTGDHCWSRNNWITHESPHVSLSFSMSRCSKLARPCYPSPPRDLQAISVELFQDLLDFPLHEEIVSVSSTGG